MAVLTQNVLTFAVPGGDVAQVSVWVLWGGAPTAAQAATTFGSVFIDSVWPSGAGGGKPYHPTGVALIQLQTRVINLATGTVLTTATVIYSRAGTAGGNSLPSEVSTVISLRTALAGGSYRGRMYLPPPSTTQVTSAGRLVSTDLSAMLTAWSNAFIALNANTTYTSATIVVYSRKLGVSTEVTSIDIGDVFDAQRRRRNSLTESRSSAVV